jgi:hypothetical protein
MKPLVKTHAVLFWKGVALVKKVPSSSEEWQRLWRLDYFGNRLCMMLDRKFAEYRKQRWEI